MAFLDFADHELTMNKISADNAGSLMERKNIIIIYRHPLSHRNPGKKSGKD
jgi:hypothetical protein